MDRTRRKRNVRKMRNRRIEEVKQMVKFRKIYASNRNDKSIVELEISTIEQLLKLLITEEEPLIISREMCGTEEIYQIEVYDGYIE